MKRSLPIVSVGSVGAGWRPAPPAPGLLLLLACLPMLLGFAHAKIGDTIENATLPLAVGEGEPAPFLGRTNVSVFVFFYPGKPNSTRVLRQLADLQERFKDRPVHWTAIVSDRIPREAVAREVQETGLKMPVLLDEGDALFGRLGVALYPVIGVTDAGRRLRHYLPFHRVNYEVLIEAAVRHALGELDDAGFARESHPGTRPMAQEKTWRTHARVNLAKRMLDRGKPGMALKLVDACLKQEPDYPEALLLKGRLLAMTGRVAEARATYARLLEVTAGSAPVEASPPPTPSSAADGQPGEPVADPATSSQPTTDRSKDGEKTKDKDRKDKDADHDGKDGEDGKDGKDGKDGHDKEQKDAGGERGERGA